MDVYRMSIGISWESHDSSHLGRSIGLLLVYSQPVCTHRRHSQHADRVGGPVGAAAGVENDAQPGADGQAHLNDAATPQVDEL